MSKFICNNFSYLCKTKITLTNPCEDLSACKTGCFCCFALFLFVLFCFLLPKHKIYIHKNIPYPYYNYDIYIEDKSDLPLMHC